MLEKPFSLLGRFSFLLYIGALTLFAMAPISVATMRSISAVSSVRVSEKVVALTFDDGPYPEFTPLVLKILAKHKVKATFFMIASRMEACPGLVKAVRRGGHAIGNHTYTHPRDLALRSPVAISDEIHTSQQVIERMTGTRASFFRPPRGLLGRNVIPLAASQGCTTILWSVSADNHNTPTPELMARRVVNIVRPGGIVLLHDGSFRSRWKDVAAASLIIEALKKQGYRFVTIPELLSMAGQQVRAASIIRQ